MCICTVFLKGNFKLFYVILKSDGRNQYIDYSRDNLRCHFKWGGCVVRVTCAAPLEWCGISSEPGQLESGFWWTLHCLLLKQRLSVVLCCGQLFIFLYYLVTMQGLYLNKLWHSWCEGVSGLWDVSHQRWFNYLKKLLFYWSWLCLAYFMELTAEFLPTLTFCQFLGQYFSLVKSWLQLLTW